MKWRSYVGASFWAAMFGLRVRQVVNGDLLGILLAIQAALVAFRLIERHEPVREASWSWRVLAWASAMLPLAIQPGGTEVVPAAGAGLLAALGLAVSLWALISLGTSFGIAPADRGLVIRGPYRWLRHPIYAGELVSVAGYILANATIWNGFVLLVLTLCLVARTMEEERIIDGYESYEGRVRWRMFPGVW